MPAFAKLIDSRQVGKVTIALEGAIARSFETHRMQHMTGAEVKRRFEMAARIFEKLRSDLKWGLDRALAKVPEYLRAELDGKPWEPDKRTIWSPEDGAT